MVVNRDVKFTGSGRNAGALSDGFKEFVLAGEVRDSDAHAA